MMNGSKFHRDLLGHTITNPSGQFHRITAHYEDQMNLKGTRAISLLPEDSKNQKLLTHIMSMDRNKFQ